MLSYQTVESHTLELLRKLSKEAFLSEVRLVGGTALALQYGHRNSVDLDFFGKIEIDDEILKERLADMGSLSVIKESSNIKIYLINDIKVDFVNYKYVWIDSAIEVDDLHLASPKDIAAMKINAIEGRGTKKDFIDMYFLLQHYSLQEIFGFYAEKYPENSIFRALMSLSYFEDAETQFMPQMFIDVEWEDIKLFIENKVNVFAQKADR